MKSDSDVVTSTGNRIVKEFRELHRSRGRRRNSQTIIEGAAVFASFLDAGVLPVSVIAREADRTTIDMCSRDNIPLTLASEHVVHAAGGTVTTPGPIAIIETPPASSLRLANTLVLVAISDPGNVGTMIRTAAAFGWDVAYTPATADPWAPKTIRSAAGSHVSTRFVRLGESLDAIRDAGLTAVASVVEGGRRPERSDTPIALMVGSEAHGLPGWVLDDDIDRVSIEMPGGIESLNAAIAAGILIYQLS